MTQPGEGDHVTSGHAGDDRMLDAEQVAELLGGGITAETVIRRWKKWQMPAHRIGKVLRWWRSEVIDYIDQHPAD